MANRRWKRIDRDVRRQVIRWAAQGKTHEEICALVKVSTGSISAVLRPLGGVFRKEMWEVSSARLSLTERVEIYAGMLMGMTFTEIAEQLQRAVSTISREVHNHGGLEGYRPVQAHRQAELDARRPKATKLAANPVLCARVIEDLEQLWSPEQIAGRLRDDFVDQPEMWVSHETIYKSIYVQGRGELRSELHRCLRTGRAMRRVRKPRMEQLGRIKDKVMISERPAEVEDRAVPGHWEGDLILGAGNKSAVVTLVERTTRFVMLGCIADQRAETVREVVAMLISRLPDALTRTLTWDQGHEMAQHIQLKIDTGIEVFFCDPYHPWQRGSNENTNGLLRQYLPKGTDLSVYTQADLDKIADSLNGRPRQTLGWKNPAEKLAEVLATTG